MYVENMPSGGQSIFLPFYFDIRYLLFSLPAVLLALFAQWRVQSAYRKYSRIRNMRNMSGLETARRLLRGNLLGHVSVQGTRGVMSDHYDPRRKVLSLSRGVAESPSVAALAIVAHEVGHAVQHHTFPSRILRDRLYAPDLR